MAPFEHRTQPDSDRAGDAPATPDSPSPAGVDAAPVGASERLIALDVVRGLAVLGILVMNMPYFALPSAIYFDPPIAGGFNGLDYFTWLASHLLFEMKMMSIFSMLFGVGVVLFAERVTATGGRAGVLHYRRMGWLLAIGLIHAYVVWEGDILVTYAICGMIAYPLRRLRPVLLVGVASALFVVPPLLSSGQSYLFEHLREQVEQRDALVAAGVPVPEEVGEQAEAWLGVRDEQTGELIKDGLVQGFYPGPEEIEKEQHAVRGSFLERMSFRAEDALFMQSYVLLTWGLWRTVALMLAGMALYKWGVFSAARSGRFFVTLALCGFGIGWPLVAYGAHVLLEIEFDTILMFRYGLLFNYIGSVGVAVGWVGLLMLLCMSESWSLARRALANVGRMAFTNYLMQSILCGAIFFGWGFGMFGSLSRSELIASVLGVWLVEIIWSWWWLSRFRFGPMEWAWRSLTYGRAQPMRA